MPTCLPLRPAGPGRSGQGVSTQFARIIDFLTSKKRIPGMCPFPAFTIPGACVTKADTFMFPYRNPMPLISPIFLKFHSRRTATKSILPDWHRKRITSMFRLLLTAPSVARYADPFCKIGFCGSITRSKFKKWGYEYMGFLKIPGVRFWAYR